MRTLVLGIGNPLLGDDGLGFHVAQRIANECDDENIEVKDTSVDGLNLLELILGYDKAIFIDSFMADDDGVGKIHRLGLESFSGTVLVNSSPHHGNLSTAIEIGRRLFPEQMPADIVVYTAGIQEVTEISESMSEKLEEAVPKMVSLIREELHPERGRTPHIQ